MGRIISDVITILLTLLPLLILLEVDSYDSIIFYSFSVGAGLIVVANTITLILSQIDQEGSKLYLRLNRLAMTSSFIIIFGLIFGHFLALDPIFSFIDWELIPFGFYFLIALDSFLILASTMSKVKHSVAMVISIPLLIFTLGSRFLVEIMDILFPPKMRDLIPYLDVVRTLIFSFTQMFADPVRLETERALASLENAAGQLDELAEGYAIRKGIGQGIDIGLTIVVFAFSGVLLALTDLGIPPALIAALFSSLALAFSTFAGLFGPFYGLAGACKEYTLRNGNYRAASFYKIVEQMFAIPFVAASAGFLFLDLPPVDAETLEDFKGEMQEQVNELTDSLSALLGRDKGDIPQKTRKMIGNLLGSTEKTLGKLDFRDIREETAREFALSYYQHEFSWKPWSRKTAVEEFAKKYNFDRMTGEENLILIGDKIRLGQMDDDLVNNVLISSAARGIIQMEEKFQELLGDVELGQTCTGLAFGARQFLKDHYIVKNRTERALTSIKNILMGIFAVPIVLTRAFHNYANRIFDKLIDSISDGFFDGRIKEYIGIRVGEVYSFVISILEKTSSQSEKEIKKKTPKEKKQRNWQVRRNVQKIMSMVWEVVLFPFVVILNTGRWFNKRLFVRERNPREEFEEAVAHAALVSMYDELFKRLVMQTHVTMG